MPITRRRFLATTAAAAALLPVRPLSRHWPADGTFTPLRRGVGTFVLRGGTIGWLATPDALVVVDTQYADTAAHCWAGLQERSARPLDLVLNTHHHGDHTSGNAFFRPHAARLVAHANVPTLQQASAQRQGSEAPTTADVTYDGLLRLEVGDETVRLQYYGPAHTRGDSVIHFENANVVHMGDLVFNRLPAYIDVGSGATTRGWIALLEQVHADFSDETIFIFGHGHADHGITGTRADLRHMRDFLSAAWAYVARGRQAGHSAEEVASVDRLPGFEAHYNPNWEGALPRMLRTIYGELEAEG